MVRAARQMVEGDLNINITVESNDEIGEIGSVFNETVQYLGSIIGEISTILDEMAGGNLALEPQCSYHGDFERIRISIENILKNMNGQILIKKQQVQN